ncbi:hypothetical protein DRP98_02615 [candidate division KSB1 bacterium]|nr:MAG: hypothetical protein DRP98_02615 [candidate division KSB1 bacterium]
MDLSRVIVKELDSSQRLFSIQPTEQFNPSTDLEDFQEAILNLLNIKQLRLVLDMTHLHSPNGSFIAFLIEISSRLRRQGGELLITHLSSTAKMNLATFSPLGYLKVLRDESELDEKVINPIKTSQNTGALTEEQSAITEIEKGVTEKIFDIVDQTTGNDIKPQHSEKIEEESTLANATTSSNDQIRNSFLNQHLVVRSREKELYRITDFVTKLAREANFQESDVGRIKIAVYEAAHNIIEHAYEFNPDNFINVIVKILPEQFVVILMDRGKSFHFEKQRSYDAVQAAEQKRTGGFGLYIIERSMDKVEYESDTKWGNRLTMIKYRP